MNKRLSRASDSDEAARARIEKARNTSAVSAESFLKAWPVFTAPLPHSGSAKLYLKRTGHSRMMTPHKEKWEEEYEQEIAEIKAITDADLAKMRIWQVVRKAIPDGLAPEVAETLGRDVRTVESWRTNPDLIAEQPGDPSGRRGYAHYYNLLILAINGPFPPGAEFLLRWQALKLARGQSIQGHERMEAITRLAEEMRAWGERLDALQADRRALEERMTAIVTGWDTT